MADPAGTDPASLASTGRCSTIELWVQLLGCSEMLCFPMRAALRCHESMAVGAPNFALRDFDWKCFNGNVCLCDHLRDSLALLAEMIAMIEF